MTLTRERTTGRRLARPLTLSVVGLLGALLGVSSALSPAHAESTTVNDPAGDHNPPYVDITKVKYNNADHRLTSVIHGSNIIKNQTYVAMNIRPLDGSGIYYQVATYGKLGHPGYVRTITRVNGDRSVRLHCGLVTHTFPALDYVTMKVPQACLGTHAGRVRMQAFLEVAYSEGGAGERAPAAVLNRGEPM